MSTLASRAGPDESPLARAAGPGARPARPRFEWIDHARGFGMVLVVLGHAMSYGFSESFLYAFIFAFHMPLFFLIAGMVRAGAPDRPLAQQAWQLARTLLVPFLFFGIVTIVAHFAIAGVATRQAPSLADIAWASALAAYGSAATIPTNTPLWFLPGLFVATLGSTALIRAVGWRPALAVTIVVALVAMLFPPPFRLPWSADTAVVAAVFFQLGLRLQPGRSVPADGGAAVPAIAAVALAAVAFGAMALILRSNQAVDMALFRFGNPLLFFAGAGFGIVGTFLIVPLLPGKALLQRLADDARVIFPLHVLVFGILTGLITLVLRIPKDNFRAEAATVPIYTVASILICIAAAVILRAISPRAIGEKTG